MSKKKTKSDSNDNQLVLSNIEQVKAITHPIRQRLFEQLAKAPATAKQLAEDLGYKPTRLYHHMEKLENAGLINLIRTEQVRGTTAKYYEAVADSLRIDPTLLGDESSAALEKAGLGVLDGLLQNLRQDIEQLFLSDCSQKETLAEEALFMQYEFSLSDKRTKHYRKRLDRLLNDLRKECEDSEEETPRKDGHRFFIGWYPKPKHS
ncbi:MAG: helix-turn-helix domain-containing protein [Pseudomonadota bacterium]